MTFLQGLKFNILTLKFYPTRPNSIPPVQILSRPLKFYPDRHIINDGKDREISVSRVKSNKKSTDGLSFSNF